MLYETLESRRVLAAGIPSVSSISTLDAGLTNATIQGLVFDDSDGDGVRDGNEPGLAGVTVYVDLNQNEVRDAGEPTVTTAIDDSQTTEIDEAGTYRFSELTDTDYQIRIETPGNLRQSAPLSPASPGPSLTPLETIGRPESTSGTQPYEILISPDGELAIVGWGQGETLSIFHRNAQDGRLTYAGDEAQPTLRSIRRSVFSADSRFLYVPASGDDAINVFRVESNATLTFVQAVTATENADLDEVDYLTIAPDGSQLFATSRRTGALIVFDIDPVAGSISEKQAFKNGVGGIDSLPSPNASAISPDGTLVVVANVQPGLLVTFFDRDPATGTLSPGQTALALGTNQDILFSADGDFIYVSDLNSRVRTLARDPGTGDFTQISQTSFNGSYPDRFVMRPDQTGLYAATAFYDKLVSLDRDPVTGATSVAEILSNNVELREFTGIEGLAVSPDAKNLYVVSRASNRIHTFSIDQAGRAADAQEVTGVLGQTVDQVNFGIAVDAPSVVSIESLTTSPTTAGVVEYQVSFDEPVTGFDTGDLELHATTLAGASIATVSGGPQQYTVSVTTPQGQGDVQLQLVDDDTIKDSDDVPLGDIGTGAIAARSSVIHVDSLAPSVVAIAPQTNVLSNATAASFFVTFNEPVTGIGHQ